MAGKTKDPKAPPSPADDESKKRDNRKKALLFAILAFQGPSGPLSGDQGPSGPLSGDQGPSGPLSGDQGPAETTRARASAS